MECLNGLNLVEHPEGGGQAQDQNKFCYNYECPQAVG